MKRRKFSLIAALFLVNFLSSAHGQFEFEEDGEGGHARARGLEEVLGGALGGLGAQAEGVLVQVAVEEEAAEGEGCSAAGHEVVVVVVGVGVAAAAVVGAVVDEGRRGWEEHWLGALEVPEAGLSQALHLHRGNLWH